MVINFLYYLLNFGQLINFRGLYLQVINKIQALVASEGEVILYLLPPPEAGLPEEG